MFPNPRNWVLARARSTFQNSLSASGRSAAARRRARLVPALDILEQRAMLASLALATAEVRPDGRTFELAFTAPLPTASGAPDWLPGDIAGTHLTTASGLELEQIGTTVKETGGVLKWTATYLVKNSADVITFGSGSVTVSAAAGLLQDASGNATAAITSFAAINRSLVDADGFTTESFARGTGGVTLYVSSTYGNDSRTFAQAQDPATPYKTPAYAMTMLQTQGKDRTGSAIRMLRGDTLAAGITIRISGQDAAHPLVFEDYWYNYTGSAIDPGTRPLLLTTTDVSAFLSNAWGAPSTPATIDNVVIRRLALNCVYTNPNAGGFFLVRGGTNWTIDDLSISNYHNGITIQGADGPYNDVTILRTTVKDSHSALARPQGAYIEATNQLLISQSTFDNNGRPDVTGTARDIYSQNIYIQNTCGPVVVWGNVIRAGGSHGIQMRSGGVLAYNYFSRNALATEVQTAGGSQYKNVVEKAEDISAAAPRGAGLLANNNYGTSGSPQVIEFNVVVNSVSTNPYRAAIGLYQSGTIGTKAGTIRHNTVVNAGMMTFEGGGPTPAHGDINVSNNIFDAKSQRIYSATVYSSWDWFNNDNNDLSSTLAAPVGWGGVSQTLDFWKSASGGSDIHSITTAPSYIDGTADIADYYADTGGANSETAFINLLRNRGLGAWESRFDTMNVYRFFANYYRGTNQTKIGDGKYDYYGAAAFDGVSMMAAGFETPALGARQIQYNPTGTVWSYSPSSPTAGAGLAANGSIFTGTPAPQGTQIAFIQAKGWISQTVGGWESADYQISFQAARRAGYAVQDFQVLVDGAVVGTFTPSASTFSRLTTPRFTVAAGGHTVKFQALNSAGGDATAFLDDLRIEKFSTALPSPPAVLTGGFEAPALGAGQYQYFPTGTNWTYGTTGGSGGAGVAVNGSPFTASLAPEGVQVAFIQTKGWMSQSLAGWAAGDYLINFASARRSGYALQDFQVLIDGLVVGTFSPTATTYSRYSSARFTVSAGTHTVTFQGLNSAGGDATSLVDDIQVQKA